MKVMLIGDKKSQKVCFLESGKEFVDALLSLLQLPTGTILKLLSDQPSSFGSLPSIFNLYNAVKDLDDHILCIPKEELVDPPRAKGIQTGLLIGDARMAANAPAGTYYGCNQSIPVSQSGGVTIIPSTIPTSRICKSLSSTPGSTCPTHGKAKLTEPFNVISVEDEQTCNNGAKGFVKEYLVYIVTDNLEVFQTSAMHGISLFNRMNMSISDLLCTPLEVTEEQMLLLIKGSFTGKAVLNSVFGSAFKKACGST